MIPLFRHFRGLLLPLFLVLLSSWSCQSAHNCRPFQPLLTTAWGLTSSSLEQHSSRIHHFSSLLSVRGGADSDDDESESDEEDEYDDTDDEEDDEEESDVEQDEAAPIAKKNIIYVDPLFPSPMMSLYSTVGIMLLSRKVDLFHPTVVKVARYGESAA